MGLTGYMGKLITHKSLVLQYLFLVREENIKQNKLNCFAKPKHLGKLKLY